MRYTMTVQLDLAEEVVPKAVEELIRKEYETFGNAVLRLISGSLCRTQHKVTGTLVTTTKFFYDTDKMISVLTEKLVRKNAPEDCLDDAVHNTASKAGSTVNNQGMEAQLRFLLEEVELEETQRIVHQIPPGDPDES